MNDQTSPDSAGAVAHALARLRAELAPTLTYHNIWHTEADVIPAALRLARLCSIPEAETRLLAVAAAYHDIGFIDQSLEHEQASIEMAAQALPAYGFVPEQIEHIASLIRATRLPQTPHTRLEEILADADLDVLGREDFFERNEQLYLEFNTRNPPMTRREWYAAQIGFLQGHTYFTAAARALRDATKHQHIAQLKQRLREMATGAL